MKQLQATLISLQDHSFLRVSKRNYLCTGLKFSDMSLWSFEGKNSLFLEGDCDMVKFVNHCEKQNIKVNLKVAYRKGCVRDFSRKYKRLNQEVE